MTGKKWLAEPLLHFLVAGAALFALLQGMQPEDPDGLTIRVGKAQLLAQLQGSAQVYDEPTFTALLARMSKAERGKLVRDAAQGEALWREGRALGLTEADPLIRARVIQQMRELLMEEAAADVAVSDAEMRAYYAANPARYAQGAQASFGHVFFSDEARGSDGAARAAAQAALVPLRAAKVSLAASGSYGDRFLYQQNYAEAGAPEIAAQFGPDFAKALFALEPEPDWQGPLRSQYGWHLVLLRAREEASVPPIEAIADRVRDDALADKRNALAQGAIDRMMQRYKVVEE